MDVYQPLYPALISPFEVFKAAALSGWQPKALQNVEAGVYIGVPPHWPPAHPLQSSSKTLMPA